MRATLVIPTLNEAASIAHVLELFRDSASAANGTIFRTAPLEWEVLVVDGASADGTAAIAEAQGARVIIERRPGYGRAYKTGFAAAQGEIIATSDGDATYPVETVPGLVKKLLDEQLDFLTGNRFAYLDRKSMTTEHRIGNQLLNFFVRVAYHRFVKAIPGGLADSQSGFWVFRRELLSKLHLTQDGMAFSEELKIEAVLRGLKVVEDCAQCAGGELQGRKAGALADAVASDRK
jgi:glycosyltransferase involved in cell wall biosynthesis